MTKKEVRMLAEEADMVAAEQCVANQYNLAMTGGESFGMNLAPNYSDLIKRWNLTRPMLLEAIDMAYEFAIRFDEERGKIDIARQKVNRRYFPNPHNPWYDRWMALTDITVAGFLNE